LNLIADLETRGNAAMGLVKDGGQISLGPFQISAKVRKELKLPDAATLQAQTQAAESLISRLRTRYGDDLEMVQLAYNNPKRAQSLAKQAGITLGPSVPTPLDSPPLSPTSTTLAVQGPIRSSTLSPMAPTQVHGQRVKPPSVPRQVVALEPVSPEVVDRIQGVRYELEHSTGLETGKVLIRDQEGNVTSSQALPSVIDQLSDYYPEFKEFPRLGPKKLIEAIDKDKGNPTYLKIQDAVTRQIEREGGMGSRAAEDAAYEARLAAADATGLPPEMNPTGQQPKLFQTQAEVPPTPLQATKPQVEHGQLLEGFRPPGAPPPRLPLGEPPPQSTGSTVGAQRYKPPPYTPEQLATQEARGAGGGPPPLPTEPVTTLPSEHFTTRLKVLAKPGFENLATQLEGIFNGKLPSPDAAFFRNLGAAIKREDVVWPGQRELLAEHGLNKDAIGDHLMRAGTTSGQFLNMLSQLSKRSIQYLNDHPEVATALDASLPPPQKPLGWFKRLENTRMALITSRISTAARNGNQGIVAAYLDAIEQGAANLVVGAQRGGMVNEMAAGMEQFHTLLRAMRPAQQREFLTMLKDYPLQQIELLSTPVQDIVTAQSRIVGGAPMAKLLQWAQFWNNMQERYVRGMTFAGSVRGEMVRRGLPLDTPSAQIPEDIITKGVQDSLRITSAARPEKGTAPGKLASRILEAYDALPVLGLINRFPKFQYANAFRFLWEHSPFGPLDLITKATLAKQTTTNMGTVKRLTVAWSKANGDVPPPPDILQGFYQQATKPTNAAKAAAAELANPKTKALAYTKSAAGLAMLALALAYRSSDDAPDHWYEVKLPAFVPVFGGKPVSFEAFAPFITFNLFAEGIRAAVAKHGTPAMQETFNTVKKPPVVEPKDLFRAAVGLNRIAGTGLVFVDLFTKGGSWPRVQDFFDQYVGGFSTTFSSYKNLVAPVRPQEAVIRDVSTAFPLTGPFRRNIPGLAETLPPSPSITRAEPRRIEHPVLGELTGLSLRTYTALEHKVNRLGLSWYELGPQTGVPEADLILKKTMGKILDTPAIERRVTSPWFERLPNPAQEKVLRELFSSARTAATQRLAATNQPLYQQVYERENKKQLDLQRSFRPQPPQR
jgi:hypothetical protein